MFVKQTCNEITVICFVNFRNKLPVVVSSQPKTIIANKSTGVMR